MTKCNHLEEEFKKIYSQWLDKSSFLPPHLLTIIHDFVISLHGEVEPLLAKDISFQDFGKIIKSLGHLRAIMLEHVVDSLNLEQRIELHKKIDFAISDLTDRSYFYFNQFLNDAPIPIGIYEGKNLKFVYINSEGCKSVQKEHADIIGRPYLEVLPKAQDRFETNLNVLKTGELIVQKEILLTTKREGDETETQKIYTFHSQPYRDVDGSVRGVMTFGNEVTAEVEARRKLENSAHRTSQILDNLPTAYFSLGPDWTITYANPGSESALGDKRENIIGKNVWELHPALIGSPFYHAYHRTMIERTTEEVINYYPDQKKWYHVISYPLDEGIAVSFSDITARKNAEEARFQIEQKFSVLLEAIPQMVWLTDARGQSTYFNSGWLSYTGTRMQDNLGVGWVNSLHPDDRQKTSERWFSSMLRGQLYEAEYRVRNADGQYLWHVARGIPLHNSDNELTQWLGTTTNIDELKQAQERLKSAVEARDEFLSIASHELKTPLTSMKLQTQLTKRLVEKDETSRSFSSSDYLEVLDRTEKNIQRLTHLVVDMLDISRLSTGKLTLSVEEVSLTGLLHDVFEKMLPLMNNVELTWELPEVDDLGLWDPFRLEQVFTNLISNAHRYGEGKPIHIKVLKVAEKVLFSIKDNGAGIRAEDQDRIFERFERASTDTFSPGLGLGLYISKQIVLMHSGSIWVHSSPGMGAEFNVELPLRP